MARSDQHNQLLQQQPHAHRVTPVAPVAYQVILEPGTDQFREFEPRRVHTRINSLGLFLYTNKLAESARA